VPNSDICPVAQFEGPYPCAIGSRLGHLSTELGQNKSGKIIMEVGSWGACMSARAELCISTFVSPPRVSSKAQDLGVWRNTGAKRDSFNREISESPICFDKSDV
jgi:hypothetical protein